MATKYPKKIGDCIDLGFGLRAQRKIFEAQVQALEAEEKALSDHMVTVFQKAEILSAKGKRGVATYDESDVPQVDPDTGGWPAIYKHIQKTGEFELLERRLGKLACRERWEAGVALPGVKKFIHKKITFTQGK